MRSLLCALVLCSSVTAAERVFFAFDNGLTDIKPLAAKADLLKELGYDGIGWRPGQTAAMLAELDRCGLKMVCSYVVLHADADHCPVPDDVMAEIKALKGRDTLIWLNISGHSRDEVVVPVIQQLCDQCAELNLKVVIYPHVGSYTDTNATALRLVKAANRSNLGLSFNLCHFLKQQDESELDATLRAASPYLWLVSMNGAERGNTRTMNWDRLIQPLGQGSFDGAHFMRLLDSIHYQGPIGLQCYQLKLPARQHLGMSIANWRELKQVAKPH